MTKGFSGPAAVPWRQTRISGQPAAPPEALRPGALWDWTGVPEPPDAARFLALLGEPAGDAALRARAARRARRLPGALPPPQPLPGPTGFVLSDGARRIAARLAPGPFGPVAVFPAGLPPRDRPFVVLEVTGPALPLSLDAPEFLPGGLAAGTGIATPAGLVAVERLGPGDRVIARDGGTRTVACSLHWDAGGGRLRLAPRLTAIRVTAGALGPGQPSRDLVLAPGQDVAVSGPAVRALFGAARVLVPAARLAGLPGIAPAGREAPRRFVRLTLSAPDLVLADGLACASAAAPLSAPASPEAFAAPPPPAGAGAARRLTGAEAARLLQALAAAPPARAQPASPPAPQPH